MEEEDPMSAPYHYGCHYSNSGTVLHFLVRMPPFTKMFLQYQGKSNKNGNRTLEWNRLVLSLIHQFRYRHSISFPILIPVPTPFPFWFLFVPFLSSSLQNYSMFWRFHCFVCVYLYITLMEILYSLADRNFDIPDRTFHSMATTWRLSSFESATDVKELIPEFFFLPEFLENREGMALGSMIKVWKWNRCYCNFWRIFI